MAKLSNKQEADKIKKTIAFMHDVKKEFKVMEKKHLFEIDKNVEEIKSYMIRHDFEALKFQELPRLNKSDTVKRNFICKRIVRKQIDFLVDKLEEKFSKENCLDFIDKEYSINDLDGLIKLLKNAGVKPNEFKKFINVKKTANKDKLEQMNNLGEIKKEDLVGCYTVTELSSYLKVTIAKNEDVK